MFSKIMTLGAAATIGGAFVVAGSMAFAQPAGGKKTKLNPPTVTCLGSTDSTITIQVCAGTDGAPGGFSVQWMPCDDFGAEGTDSSGWWPSDSDNLCKASFSGQANQTNWNLGPNECRDITIGNFVGAGFGESGGFSTNCPGLLECDACYMFRAFAHNQPGRNGLGKSDFSADVECATDECENPPQCDACTWSQGGFGNNNGCAALTAGTAGIYPVTVGGVTFNSADEACDYLGSSGQGAPTGWFKNTVALYFNIAINGCCFGNLELCNFAEGNLALNGAALTAAQAAALNGQTINDVMAAADAYMAAGAQGLNVPYGLAHNQFVTLLDLLNHSYHVNDSCEPSFGDHLCDGEPCGGEPDNPNPECAGADCFTFFPCIANTTCVCVTLFGGGGLCVEGQTGCAGLALCPDGDCPPGEVCAVGTCCGVNVCVPPSAFCDTSGLTLPGFSPKGDGPIIGLPVSMD